MIPSLYAPYISSSYILFSILNKSQRPYIPNSYARRNTVNSSQSSSQKPFQDHEFRQKYKESMSSQIEKLEKPPIVKLGDQMLDPFKIAQESMSHVQSEGPGSILQFDPSSIESPDEIGQHNQQVFHETLEKLKQTQNDAAVQDSASKAIEQQLILDTAHWDSGGHSESSQTFDDVEHLKNNSLEWKMIERQISDMFEKEKERIDEPALLRKASHPNIIAYEKEVEYEIAKVREAWGRMAPSPRNLTSCQLAVQKTIQRVYQKHLALKERREDIEKLKETQQRILAEKAEIEYQQQFAQRVQINDLIEGSDPGKDGSNLKSPEELEMYRKQIKKPKSVDPFFSGIRQKSHTKATLDSAIPEDFDLDIEAQSFLASQLEDYKTGEVDPFVDPKFAFQLDQANIEQEELINALEKIPKPPPHYFPQKKSGV